jgi:hypothetical protein
LNTRRRIRHRQARGDIGDLLAGALIVQGELLAWPWSEDTVYDRICAVRIDFNVSLDLWSTRNPRIQRLEE